MPDTPAHWKAMLDADGKLLGFDKSGKADGGIEVPVDCDLKIGGYRWDAAAESWQAILKEFPRDLPPGRYPDHQVAMALALRRLSKTVELPRYTQEWLRGFERYPDDMPSGDEK